MENVPLLILDIQGEIGPSNVTQMVCKIFPSLTPKKKF
jgi:hypothetical protein